MRCDVSSRTASTASTAVAGGAAAEGTGNESRHMMHCSGSAMAAIAIAIVVRRSWRKHVKKKEENGGNGWRKRQTKATMENHGKGDFP